MTTRPLSVPKILIAVLAAVLFWMAASIGYLYFEVGYSLQIALADGVISVLFLAISCASLSNLIGFYQPKKEKILYILILISVLMLVSVYPPIYILKWLFTEELDYLYYLESSYYFRVLFAFIFLGWCTLTCQLYYKVAEQSDMQERLLITQNLAKEAELNKLRHQLQPHFLFNSLNSVYALTIMNPTEAGVMITKLASFLRGTLKRDDEVWVKVEEEMEYIQLYLDIEKVRFSHRLNVAIQIEEEALKMCLPGTFLQPIVENAIKFGLYNTSAKITISISVKVQNNVLLIRVENPYDPKFTSEKGTGFGLSAIRRRLYLLFGDSQLLGTESIDDSLYITTLKIPQTNDKNHIN